MNFRRVNADGRSLLNDKGFAQTFKKHHGNVLILLHTILNKGWGALEYTWHSEEVVKKESKRRSQNR